MNGAVDLTGYHLSFDAEMTTSADMAFFSTSYNNGDRSIPTNGEAEYYAPYSPGTPGNPYTFQNGELTITATPTPIYGYPYTSGLITTGQSFYQNQGYFEIRAELPSGAGFWSAFWMLAGDNSAEIDILEQPNKYGIGTYFNSVKTSTYSSGVLNNTPDESAGYHSYGFMWTATSIQFTFDGAYIGYAAATPAVLAGVKAYLIANLAVGGYTSWPGVPVAGTSAQYRIDYIRDFSNDPSVPVWYASEAVSPPLPPPSSFQPTLTIGSGPDLLTLQIAEDAAAGDAQFTVSVDGKQVGGVLTATAIHGAGATQALDVLGSFGAGAHTATVNFLNGAASGSPSTGRNLYVTQASLDNTAVPASSLAEYSSGPQSFAFQSAATPVDTLTLGVSEDAWDGDAQYIVSVDGKQAGGVYTAIASHAAGKIGQQVITGSWGSGAHTVGVTFINDAWGGSAATDRNLYVNTVNYDGVAVPITTIAEYSNGTASIATPVVPPPVAQAPPPDTLTLGVSEDAWQGDAQYTVSVDGQQAGGVYTATASHAAGLITQQTITGSFGKGPHTIGITFLNDAWGGSAATDRNLYVNAVNYDGAAVAMSSVALYSNGTANIAIPAAANPSVLTLHMSEDAYQGDAQFTVAIDGKQTGGTQTVTAPNATGASQAFSLGATLSAGSHDVAVSFLNALPNPGGSSPAGRTLYVAGAELNGTALSASVWGGTLTTVSTSHFSLVVPS